MGYYYIKYDWQMSNIQHTCLQQGAVGPQGSRGTKIKAISAGEIKIYIRPPCPANHELT